MLRLPQLGWLRLRPESWHPTEDEVLQHLDGELSDRKAKRVRAHLEACWTCRARAQRTQEAITDFAEFAGGSLPERIPPAPQGWSGFEAGLRNLAQEPPAVPDTPVGKRETSWVHRPALASALLVLLAVGMGILVFQFWTPTVSAAQLLERARAADTQVAASPDIVLRRIVRLDARRLPDGALSARGRVEVWQSGARGIKARRYYDENNRLVAGEWRRATGSRTVYRPGQPPRSEAGVEVIARDVWLWDATAEDYSRLIADVNRARVSDDGTTYEVRYRPPDGGARGLVEARLTITKQDLRVSRQALVLREDGAIVEYSLTEAGYEPRPAAQVSPSVFEPEPVLTAALAPSKPEPPPLARPAPRPAVDAAARATLEIEAVHGLHRAGLSLPESGSVTVSEDGRVVVAVRVADEARKALVEQALADHPRVRLEITTVPVEASPGVPAEGTPPMYAAIKRRLERDGAQPTETDALDRAAKLYAQWAVDQSAVRLRSAEALRNLGHRWPLDTLAKLDLGTLTKWQTMIRDHVRAIGRDTELLRTQLDPVLVPGGEVPSPRGDTPLIQDVGHVPGRLDQLVDDLNAQHALVRRLFAPAESPQGPPLSDRAALSASLRELEATTHSFGGPWWLGR